MFGRLNEQKALSTNKTLSFLTSQRSFDIFELQRYKYVKKSESTARDTFRRRPPMDTTPPRYKRTWRAKRLCIGMVSIVQPQDQLAHTGTYPLGNPVG